MRTSHILTGLCAFAAGIVLSLAVTVAVGRLTPHEESSRVDAPRNQAADADGAARERLASVQAAIDGAREKLDLPCLMTEEAFIRALRETHSFTVIRLPHSDSGRERDWTRWRIPIKKFDCSLTTEAIGSKLVWIDFEAPAALVQADPRIPTILANSLLAPWVTDLPVDWIEHAIQEKSTRGLWYPGDRAVVFLKIDGPLRIEVRPSAETVLNLVRPAR
jgi:hypothetical protein